MYLSEMVDNIDMQTSHVCHLYLNVDLMNAFMILLDSDVKEQMYSISFESSTPKLSRYDTKLFLA